VFSPAPCPEVAKNDPHNLINSFTWGWHFLNSRELEATASKSSKMLTTLLFQKVQQSFRARRRPIITNFAYRVWQEFKLAMKPLGEARDVVSNLEPLGLGPKALQGSTIGSRQICPPLVTVGLVFLLGVFELTFQPFQLCYKVVVGIDFGPAARRIG
jgi:hypothetical protein